MVLYQTVKELKPFQTSKNQKNKEKEKTMRGYLIEMAYDKESVGQLNANDFTDTKDGHKFAEWYENGDDQKCFGIFQVALSKYSVVFGDEDGIRYVSFTDGSKRAIFEDCYKRFLKEVDNMTFEKFSSGGIQACQRLVEDTYGDAVYLSNEGYAITMDEFMRQAEPGERFYIGNILLMH